MERIEEEDFDFRAFEKAEHRQLLLQGSENVLEEKRSFWIKASSVSPAFTTSAQF